MVQAEHLHPWAWFFSYQLKSWYIWVALCKQLKIRQQSQQTFGVLSAKVTFLLAQHYYCGARGCKHTLAICIITLGTQGFIPTSLPPGGDTV